MLNIGLVGLGAIAKKAYLPIYHELPDITWHLYTRNAVTLEQEAALFKHAETYTDFDDLLAANLDGLFIHAATPAHDDLASKALQESIPVYMDKPLTEDFTSTLALYQLAETQHTFLTAGFNRRFAPAMAELKNTPDQTRIFVEKNEVAHPGAFQYQLFDLFIHPLDTALFLLNKSATSADFHYHAQAGQLKQIQVNLYNQETSVTVSMNLEAGVRSESMQVQSPSGTKTLQDLTELSIKTGTDLLFKPYGSWVPTLEKRGFDPLVKAFLEAVKSKKNPISPASSLLSHWLCHQINQAGVNYGQLNLELPWNCADLP